MLLSIFDLTLNARPARVALLACLTCAVGCDLADPQTFARSERPLVAQGNSTWQWHAQSIEQALSKVEARIGTKAKLLELRMTSESMVLQYQPKDRAEVLQLEYHAHSQKLTGPIPVSLRGTGTLEHNLFELQDVRLSAVPNLAELAIQRVDPQDGKLSEVVVRRSLPFSRRVRIRLYVNSPRLSGHMDANAKGVPLEG